MKQLPDVITIDGPASSGKSTVGAMIARELKYIYFDTGVMYRAVTLAVIRAGIPISDESSITALAEKVAIDVREPSKQDGRQYDVFLDGEDVTWQIRTVEVEKLVSPVSVIAGVRTAMTRQQRQIGLRGRVVMVGRDIGTVVLPEAKLKVYLDASAEERARRRYKELVERGESAVYESILAGIKNRDEIDSHRAIAPLKPAEDAVIINTDNIPATEVVRQILRELE